MSSKHLQYHREVLQRKSQQDWANREYVQLIATSITRIADFLNTFHRSCSGRLANLDERLTSLERKVVFLETKVGQSQSLGKGYFCVKLYLRQMKVSKFSVKSADVKMSKSKCKQTVKSNFEFQMVQQQLKKVMKTKVF